jgi:HEAT repeat protein
VDAAIIVVLRRTCDSRGGRRMVCHSRAAGDAARALGDRTKPVSARRIAAEKLQHADASIVPGLIEELRGGDDLGRELAALALGRMGTKARDAVEVLAEATHDRTADVRRQAAISLGRIDAQPRLALAGLRDSAHDADGSVRDEAFAALGRQSPDGGSELVALLADHDADVRRRAAIGLGQMSFHTDEAKGRLRQALADSGPRVRAETYAALYARRGPA